MPEALSAWIAEGPKALRTLWALRDGLAGSESGCRLGWRRVPAEASTPGGGLPGAGDGGPGRCSASLRDLPRSRDGGFCDGRRRVPAEASSPGVGLPGANAGRATKAAAGRLDAHLPTGRAALAHSQRPRWYARVLQVFHLLVLVVGGAFRSLQAFAMASKFS